MVRTKDVFYLVELQPEKIGEKQVVLGRTLLVAFFFRNDV